MFGYFICIIFGGMLGMSIMALIAASDDRSDKR